MILCTRLLLLLGVGGLLCACPPGVGGIVREGQRQDSQKPALSPLGARPPQYTNRLIHEKSPYLLLHAHNPVDWYPWGEEAFKKAKNENKPIFLSIGYFTCHWCHVMEKESYSDPSVAAILNKYFVSVKVDREERPDVDRLYIAYVEATTGSAGWPLNVFLTPDRRPFLGGTYFPPDELKQLLEKVAQAWATQRDRITKTAGRAGEQLALMVTNRAKTPSKLEVQALDTTYQQIAATYDHMNGGFGAAPKFARPVLLNYLLRDYARTGNRSALDMTLNTLRAMKRGGIHDQLGGGFHRYSTASTWRVPHFEKMLYDQAQLAVVYTEAFQITHDPVFETTTQDILEFTIREMQQPGGGFASALDADSPLPGKKGETAEGAYYVWTEEEIENVLGERNAAVFGYAYGVERPGNVPLALDIRGELKGKNVLYESQSTEDTARRFHLTVAQTAGILGASRKALFDARARRPHPPIDDKIVTAWNGMMVSALAQASQAFDDKSYLEQAEATAEFIEAHLYDAKSGKLWRSFRAGGPSVDGFLDDYTDLISGLIDLYQTGFNVHWLEWAVRLQERQDRLFADPKEGGYFDASGADPDLLARTREAYDGAEPSPNAMAAMNLLRLAQITGREDWKAEAGMTLQAFGARIEMAGESVPAFASALDFQLARTKQILIAGSPGADDTDELLRQVNERFLPNKILLLADGGAGQKRLAQWLPFVAGAHRVGGQATAYICENYVCKLPTTDPHVVGQLLSGKD
jgi:uncharacterized protein YyaL (SSP411 family)